MPPTDDLQSAAARLGVPVNEVADVVPHEYGDVVTTSDGVAYIIVGEDTPDAEGKTGVMYLAKPHANDAPVGFPIFAQVLDDEAPAGEGTDTAPAPGGEDLDVPTGSMKMVLGWVHELGEDQVPARAQAALTTERAGQARKGLIEELEAILEPAVTPEDQAALDALAPEQLAELGELSPEDLEALAALTPEELEQLAPAGEGTDTAPA